MQKTEAQHSLAQNQPAQRQGGNAALESPQGEQIAQLEALVESSPQVGGGARLAAMANDSPAVVAQRKMASMIHNSPLMAEQRKAADGVHGRPKPVQRLANKHGLTLPGYQTATGWTVLGWGRLTGPGITTDLNAVSAGAPGHAEDQLIAQATAIIGGLAVNPYTELEIWISSSPCSTAFGTRVGVLQGCLEELQVFAAGNGMTVRVHAQKPYQPRGMGSGMKQNSVDAANLGGIPHDFDTRTGIAAGLAAYVPPLGIPGGLGTVAQLSNDTEGRKTHQLNADAEPEEKNKEKGKVIVTYE